MVQGAYPRASGTERLRKAADSSRGLSLTQRRGLDKAAFAVCANEIASIQCGEVSRDISDFFFFIFFKLAEKKRRVNNVDRVFSLYFHTSRENAKYFSYLGANKCLSSSSPPMNIVLPCIFYRIVKNYS